MNGRADVVRETRQCQLGGAHSAADGALRLEHCDVAAAARQRDGRREAVGSGTDYNRRPVHAVRSPVKGMKKTNDVAPEHPLFYLADRMLRRADTRVTTRVVTMMALLCVACSPKRLAINKLGDALANPGTTYAADDDPELIAQAAPFSLKLIGGLLESSPKHAGLLLAAASGFTQYSYAFVQQQADFVEDTNVARASALRLRARKLDLRARDYGLRGLDVRHPGFATRLRQDPRAAVRQAERKDVPFLYWTAAAWGAAISVSKDVPELVADQTIIEALIDRALELDETFSAGAIHDFLITYEMARQGATGDAAARSRQHFDRAVAISKG